MRGESKVRRVKSRITWVRISGPLLDRIDLHVEVPPVKFREIAGDRTGETSAQIRERVVAARQRQISRFKDKPKITCNARMGSRELKQFCALEEATKELLKNAMAEYNLSARAYDRILKVARTIADLAGAEAFPATIFRRRFNTARWIGSCGREFEPTAEVSLSASFSAKVP